MTFDQIEETRRGEQPSLSLQAAARKTRLPFDRCRECKGSGYTKATLLVSPAALRVLARECPNEPVPIQYDRCGCCGGSGGFVRDEIGC